MPNTWYALRSKPRKEDIVWNQLQLQGFNTYYPRLRVRRENPRARNVVPYFPGYLFINVDLDQIGLSTLQWMPHTLGLVSFGDEPAIVPDSLIYSIRKRVDEINLAGGELFDGLTQGDIVIISDGPFQGYEAIFDARLPGSERVRVLLELLSNKRRVSVEMSVNQIERKRKSKEK